MSEPSNFRQGLLSSVDWSQWIKILDRYDYPLRPCDTSCMDGCFSRPSCPLYTAWEKRKSMETKNE